MSYLPVYLCECSFAFVCFTVVLNVCIWIPRGLCSESSCFSVNVELYLNSLKCPPSSSFRLEDLIELDR